MHQALKGLVFFDCDGVLTVEHSSWGVLHEYFGSRDNSYFADLYKRGLISYLDWMKIDIALMIHSYGRPITKKDVVKALSGIRIRSSAKRVVEMLKEDGFKPIVISSGVDLLVSRVCRELGISECYYNELLFIDDELIPGGVPRVPPDKKLEIMHELAEKYGIPMNKTAYVGDSSWDITIFRNVGVSFAVNPCGMACRYADYVVEDLIEIPEYLKKLFR